MRRRRTFPRKKVEKDVRPDESTWYCLRRDGVPQRRGWIVDAVSRRLPDRLGAREGDVVEVCVSSGYRSVAPERVDRVFCNRARGVVGMEIEYRGEVHRLSPTRMLAANLGFPRALEKFLERRRASVADFAAGGGLRVFSARQFLLTRRGGTEVTRMYRGGSVVSPSPGAGEDRAADLAAGIAGWMLRNQATDGSLPYKYWPSRGVVARSDNAIRRFLATLALARWARRRGDAVVREAALRNLRSNLSRYFRPLGDGRGAIVERTGAKLGAAALAGLAILETPGAQEFARELEMLAAGVESLAGDERGFRTFFFPPERDGQNWNFYSGEAMLFWAEAVRQRLAWAPSTERWSTTFSRCRARHLEARNPAFVPWHTQACASMYDQTGRRELADFALEISDWLLPMQQWDGLASDLRGRFYDPRRPEFGAPHAASTGVYLEGLADAVRVARAVGNEGRAAAYERAVGRGLRSLRQLQFRDERDAFYVSRKGRVMGALRTEAYDNTVRIDSAAHALLAAAKISELGPQSAGGRT